MAIPSIGRATSPHSHMGMYEASLEWGLRR